MKLLFSDSDIDSAIYSVAYQVVEEYAGESLVVVPVLTGSMQFSTQLIKAIGVVAETVHKVKPQIFIHPVMCGGYEGTQFKGSVHIQTKRPTDEVQHTRKWLIVDDIYDQGHTFARVAGWIYSLNIHAEVKVAALIDKPEAEHRVGGGPDFHGRTLTGAPWIVGFGMDYKERFRDLPQIFELEEEDK